MTRWGFCLALLLSLVAAAPTLAGQLPQPPLEGERASTEFSNAFTRIEQSVQRSAESAQRNLLEPRGGNPAGMGTTLLSILAAIALFWQMGTQVLEGGEFIEYAGNYLRTVFLIALAFWMMPGANGQGAILTFVQSLTTDVAGAISGTDGGLADIVGSALSSFFRSFATVGDQIGKVMADGVQQANSSLPDGIVAFAVFFANIPAMLFLVAAAIILLVSAVIYFLMAVVGTFMFAIAMILAPLFIPFLVLHATSWLFDGWLRFLIAACLYKIVGAAIMTLGNGVLANTTQDISNASWAGLFVYAILTAAISAALAYMMLQLTSIAQGLLNGNGVLSMGRMMSRMNRGAQLSGAAGMAAGGAALRGAAAVMDGSARTAATNAVSTVRTAAASAIARANNTVQFAKLSMAVGSGRAVETFAGAAKDSLAAGGTAFIQSVQDRTAQMGVALEKGGNSLTNSARKRYADATDSSAHRSLTLRKIS